MKDTQHIISDTGPHIIRRAAKDPDDGSPVNLIRFFCRKCHHAWGPRSDTNAVIPKVCPKCKSYQWDRPRTSAAGRKKAS